MKRMTEMTIYDFVKRRTTCAKKLLSEEVQELLYPIVNYVSDHKKRWRMRCTITESDNQKFCWEIVSNVLCREEKYSDFHNIHMKTNENKNK